MFPRNAYSFIILLVVIRCSFPGQSWAAIGSIIDKSGPRTKKAFEDGSLTIREVHVLVETIVSDRMHDAQFLRKTASREQECFKERFIFDQAVKFEKWLNEECGIDCISSKANPNFHTLVFGTLEDLYDLYVQERLSKV